MQSEANTTTASRTATWLTGFTGTATASDLLLGWSTALGSCPLHSAGTILCASTLFREWSSAPVSCTATCSALYAAPFTISPVPWTPVPRSPRWTRSQATASYSPWAGPRFLQTRTPHRTLGWPSPAESAHTTGPCPWTPRPDHSCSWGTWKPSPPHAANHHRAKSKNH